MAWLSALMTVVAAASQTPAPQTVPAAATKIAVVNVARVSDGYLRTKDLEAYFNQQRVQYNEQRTAMRDRLERGTASLREELKPGTPEYDQRRKELAQLEWELQYFQDAQGQKLEQGLASSLRLIYEDIQQVVAQVAQEKGYDLVLTYDQLPAEPPDTTSMARQQIVLQKVIYWSPGVDLTDEVIARLNAKHQSVPPTQPPAPAPAKGDAKKKP
ncbi:MAG TPA: OmpH family outer membrane protein [Phycisphaerae bacterium]|nr:OmpH family outer membrane protein [Phycisphaerae bacterium]HNU46705.1 OmpH family outer membrane protein [Phycisphaerae bacterium]